MCISLISEYISYLPRWFNIQHGEQHIHCVHGTRAAVTNSNQTLQASNRVLIWFFLGSNVNGHVGLFSNCTIVLVVFLFYVLVFFVFSWRMIMFIYDLMTIWDFFYINLGILFISLSAKGNNSLPDFWYKGRQLINKILICQYCM